MFINTYFGWEKRVLILSLLAIFMSLLFIILSELSIINKLFLKINNKSIHDDIWHDIINYKSGTSLRIIYEDAIYTGVLVGHEEKGLDSWFVLEDYIVEENGVSYSSEGITYMSRLAVNLKNVKRVELFYGELTNSKLTLILRKLFSKKINRIKNKKTSNK